MLVSGATSGGRRATPPTAKGSIRSSPNGMPNPHAMLPYELWADERAIMSTCAGPTSSEQQKKKVCEACGKEFLCKSMAAGCWCEEILLTAAAREEISRRYRDCLCRKCLEQFVPEIGGVT